MLDFRQVPGIGFFFAAVLLCSIAATAVLTQPRVNAIVGDASWRESHSSLPATADEVTRIRTHLEYVRQKLAQADTGHLGVEERQRREVALGHLREYAEAGTFPRRSPEDVLPTRRPMFIDDDGTHCAVGELIRRSGDPQLARRIDESWEFDLVEDIDSPELAVWAASHGFEPEELAMIQPMYVPSNPIAAFVVTYVILLVLLGWLGGVISGAVSLAYHEEIGGWRCAGVALVGACVLPLELMAIGAVGGDSLSEPLVVVIASVGHLLLTLVAVRRLEKRYRRWWPSEVDEVED